MRKLAFSETEQVAAAGFITDIEAIVQNGIQQTEVTAGVLGAATGLCLGGYLANPAAQLVGLGIVLSWTAYSWNWVRIEIHGPSDNHLS